MCCSLYVVSRITQAHSQPASVSLSPPLSGSLSLSLALPRLLYLILIFMNHLKSLNSIVMNFLCNKFNGKSIKSLSNITPTGNLRTNPPTECRMLHCNILHPGAMRVHRLYPVLFLQISEKNRYFRLLHLPSPRLFPVRVE